jgi:hypothetical protein
LYAYHGHTDIKELALYIQDAITIKNWSLNLGLRGDLYNGLVVARQAEPRLGVAYNIKRTNTILRVSYARTLESPFNENLVLSSTGCANPVLNPLLLCSQPASAGATPFNPGYRNDFHAGLQQALGRYAVISGDYIWKYTHNAYDFSVLGVTRSRHGITSPAALESRGIDQFPDRSSLGRHRGSPASPLGPCFFILTVVNFIE